MLKGETDVMLKGEMDVKRRLELEFPMVWGTRG